MEKTWSEAVILAFRVFYNSSDRKNVTNTSEEKVESTRKASTSVKKRCFTKLLKLLCYFGLAFFLFFKDRRKINMYSGMDRP